MNETPFSITLIPPLNRQRRLLRGSEVVAAVLVRLAASPATISVACNQVHGMQGGYTPAASMSSWVRCVLAVW